VRKRLDRENRTLLTFADSRYQVALNRLRQQAILSGAFDSVITLTETDLDADFVRRHSSLLRKDVRGFGYWIWKPFIIKQTLDSLSANDALLYLDAGCHINTRGLDRLEFYFAQLRESEFGITVFQARKPDPPLLYDGRKLPQFLDESWTKGDLIDRMSVRGNSAVLRTPTIGAGIMLLRAQSPGSRIIDEWLAICEEDHRYIDDSVSTSPNEDAFVEHRHDQSVFSLLVKKHGVPTLSAFEYWYPRDDSMNPDWEALDSFPIHARRDLGRNAMAPRDRGGVVRRSLRGLVANFRKVATREVPR